MNENSVSNVGDDCTGCSACQHVCPKGAIKMKLNKNGFIAACVDASLCISCGRCKKVCQACGINGSHLLSAGELLAAHITDKEILFNCTSGGIAHSLAIHLLENGWTVAGVIYDYELQCARGDIALSVDDVNKFRGSKYLQANVGDTYRRIITSLKNDHNVKYAVFGTPCQITGLSNIADQLGFGERLMLVDLFCHGVPSHLFWKSYLNEIAKKHGIEKPLNIEFRSKKQGWHDFCMIVEDEHKRYFQTSEADPFYRAYFDNVLLNPACAKCETRMHASSADVRLGDFWGKKFQSNSKGVSAVLIFTQRGKAFIDVLATNGKVNVLCRANTDECLSAQSVEKYEIIEQADNCFRMLESGEKINDVIKAYRSSFSTKRKMKLAVKEMTAILPLSIRSKIRKIYRKMN